MKECTIVEDVPGENNNIFRCLEWEDTDDWKQRLKDKLIPIIKEIYNPLSPEDISSALQNTNFSDSNFKFKLDLIPEKYDGSTPQFDVRRSDFAEIIARITLQDLFQTKIPFDNIKMRERSDKSARGIDIVGYEQSNDDKMQLIICEVKLSTEVSPPRIVDQTEDSLSKQIKKHLKNKGETTTRLLELYNKVADQTQRKILLKIISMLITSNEDLSIVACPFLVRERSLYEKTDFGSFLTNQQQFNPATLRFIIVCFHEKLKDLFDDIFDEAKR
jgi:hypothetical protein